MKKIIMLSLLIGNFQISSANSNIISGEKYDKKIEYYSSISREYQIIKKEYGNDTIQINWELTDKSDEDGNDIYKITLNHKNRIMSYTYIGDAITKYTKLFNIEKLEFSPDNCRKYFVVTLKTYLVRDDGEAAINIYNRLFLNPDKDDDMVQTEDDYSSNKAGGPVDLDMFLKKTKHRCDAGSIEFLTNDP